MSDRINEACQIERYMGTSNIERVCIQSAEITIKKGHEFAKQQCKEAFGTERVMRLAESLKGMQLTSVHLELDASFLSDNDDLDLKSLTQAQSNLVGMIVRHEQSYSACIIGINKGLTLK
tara:strand:+ start:37235 stop:37594 length:360 start_codon:yes stop_codon:yes gene_type:complete